MGNTGHMGSATVEALRAVLEAYGADQARWPDDARVRLALLLATDASAQRLLAEATALDRLLDAAEAEPATAGLDVSAVRGRILAAAAATPQERIAGRAGASGALRPEPAVKPFAPPPFLRARANAAGWPVATALAASLVLGLVAGARGNLEIVSGPLTGIGTALDGEDETEIAFAGEGSDFSMEDVE
jgi:hypothetical protein